MFLRTTYKHTKYYALSPRNWRRRATEACAPQPRAEHFRRSRREGIQKSSPSSRLSSHVFFHSHLVVKNTADDGPAPACDRDGTAFVSRAHGEDWIGVDAVREHHGVPGSGDVERLGDGEGLPVRRHLKVFCNNNNRGQGPLPPLTIAWQRRNAAVAYCDCSSCSLRSASSVDKKPGKAK